MMRLNFWPSAAFGIYAATSLSRQLISIRRSALKTEPKIERHITRPEPITCKAHQGPTTNIPQKIASERN
jgi:hypothetical protein